MPFPCINNVNNLCSRLIYRCLCGMSFSVMGSESRFVEIIQSEINDDEICDKTRGGDFFVRQEEVTFSFLL